MLEPLKEALFQANVSGMTISQVNGCGKQHGWSEYFRGNEVILNMVPKIRFEIILEDSEVDNIVDVIVSTARTGEVGDGKIFVTDVERVVRIRTGEENNEAL
jgi:nitrogen regulatory protein P-II 1